MIQGNQIRKGMLIMHNNEPTLVLSHSIASMGRQGAHNKTKVKGLISGNIVPVTFYGNDKVEEAEVNYKTVQFVYEDGNSSVFMNPETYEQIYVQTENIPGEKDFLKEEVKYVAAFYDGKVISIQLPKKVALKVTRAPEAIKGDTANNPQKEVETETGFKAMTPMFIKEGDVIEINTETGEYTGKGN